FDADCVAATAEQALAVGQVASEPACRQRLQLMAAAPGIEHIGNELDVVEGRELDAALLQQDQRALDVMADLQHRGVLEYRAQSRQRLALRYLSVGASAAEQIGRSRSVPERQVGASARREHERDADRIGG